MNMIWLNDVTTGNQVAVNTKYITAVFEPTDGAPEGAVAIVGLVNGMVAVTQTVDAVVELIRGS